MAGEQAGELLRLKVPQGYVYTSLGRHATPVLPAITEDSVLVWHFSTAQQPTTNSPRRSMTNSDSNHPRDTGSCTGSYSGRRSGWSRGLRSSVSIDSARVTSCDIDHASARAIRSMVP